MGRSTDCLSSSIVKLRTWIRDIGIGISMSRSNAINTEYIWETMKLQQPSVYKWALMNGASVRQDMHWDRVELGLYHLYGPDKYMYCNLCGTLYRRPTTPEPLSRSPCCENGVLLHFIVPIWMPDKLLVLTLELFDCVQTIT